MTFIYVIEALAWPTSIVKIGITEHPHKRLGQISTACPHRVSLVEYWKLPSRQHAEHLEAYIHDWFAEFRSNGEWFIGKPVADIIGEICFILAPLFYGDRRIGLFLEHDVSFGEIASGTPAAAEILAAMDLEP